MRISRGLTIFIAAALTLVMLFAGCSKTSPELTVPSSRIVQDDLGRSVKLPEEVERVVSLAPSLTESIFAVGAGDKLIGVTTYCNYPEAAKSIEKIGDTQTPNIERIIALKPDLVFVSTASQLEAFLQTLEQQNIAVYVSNPRTLPEVFQGLLRLGEVTGRSSQAKELVSDLSGRASLIRHLYSFEPTGPRAQRTTFPKVFVQISNEPLFTIGKDSFITELIEYANGVSVTADVPSAYPKLSKETASAMNPEVLILSDSEDNREPNAVFKNSDAVKNGHVFHINADIISRPGPRLVDALEQIAAFLHK